jgi:hypothetical protein
LSPHEELKLAEYLAGRVCDRATGRLDEECLVNYPRDVYFIGNLRSSAGAAAIPSAPHIPELINKLAPVAFGAEFRLMPTGVPSITISLHWACYYRIFPTYDQQRKFQEGIETRQRTIPEKKNVQSTATPDEEEDETADAQDAQGAHAPIEGEAQEEGTLEKPDKGSRSSRRKDTLMPRFRKIQCSATGAVAIQVTADGEIECSKADLENAINAELARVQQLIASDPDAIKVAPDAHAVIHVPDDALSSPEKFRSFVNQNTTRVIPSWQWEVRCEVRATGTGEVVFPFSSRIIPTVSCRQKAKKIRTSNPSCSIRARGLLSMGVK